jgi:hypothetical protein
MANAAVNIKPMMTQFEPNVSIATSSWFPSIGSNQTSGRQGGGRINTGILPRMTGLPAAEGVTSADTHGLFREAVALGSLVSLQGIDRDQRPEVPDKHQGAEHQFAGGGERRRDAG